MLPKMESSYRVSFFLRYFANCLNFLNYLIVLVIIQFLNFIIYLLFCYQVFYVLRHYLAKHGRVYAIAIIVLSQTASVLSYFLFFMCSCCLAKEKAETLESVSAFSRFISCKLSAFNGARHGLFVEALHNNEQDYDWYGNAHSTCRECSVPIR